MTDVVRSRAADFPNGVSLKKLDAEIAAKAEITTVGEGVSTTGDEVLLHFAGTITGAELTALGAVIAAHIAISDAEKMTQYKNVIDVCSQRVIEKGFTWATKVFSLSTNAQIKWIGLNLNKSAFTYPYMVTTLDNSQSHSIADEAEVGNMYLTAVGTIDAAVSAGTVAKDDMDGAADSAAARVIAVTHLNATQCSGLVASLGP